MEEKNLLEIQDLVIRFHTDDGVIEAVNGISLSLKAGETLGLVGETGAGPSTTALGILGRGACPPGRVERGQRQNQDFIRCRRLLHIRCGR